MKRLTLILLLVVIALGCTKDPIYVNISHAPVSIQPEDYAKLRKRWSRKKKIIHKFDTTLDVHATLLSWEFRWAYVVKYTQLYNLDASERKSLWATQEEELNDAVQFVVAVACTDNKWNDLDKGTPAIRGPGKSSKGSTWRIALKVDDNAPVAPKEVVSIEPIKKIHRNMFPFIGHFHRLYRISFPSKVKGVPVMGSKARKITLSFASPLGKTKLEWFTNNYIISKDE